MSHIPTESIDVISRLKSKFNLRAGKIWKKDILSFSLELSLMDMLSTDGEKLFCFSFDITLKLVPVKARL